MSRREGVSRLRFLNTRNNNRGRVMVAVAVGDGEDPAQWEYEIHFAREKSGVRPVVISEIVRHFGTEVYDNTAAVDSDPELATQTALEQVSVNRDFRDLVEFFAGIEYLHLVPQIVRDATRGGIDAHDPYGGSLLLEVGTAPKKDYERRRRVMQEALRLAVPQFESLERFQDPAGSWHLRAQYRSAGALVERLLGASLVSETLLVRIAVRAVESWLLADHDGVREYFATSAVVSDPETALRPKRELVGACRRSRTRRIRDEMVPRDGSGAALGPGYANCVYEFARDHRDPVAAAVNAPSLARAIERMHERCSDGRW